MSKIQGFRSFICKVSVDAFMLHTKDEYLNEYSEELVELCGFTGTNALLIITKANKCQFFTDERYTTQAHIQLDQNIFQVHNVKEKSPQEWIKANLTSITSLGYYSECFSLKEIRKYKGICKLVPFLREKHIYKAQTIVSHLSSNSSQKKCKRIAEEVASDALLLTDPNSISWLLNLRNESARYTPCIWGRALLYKKGNIDLFVQNKQHLTIQVDLDDHISIFDVCNLESSLRKLNSVTIDPSTAPMSIVDMIKSKQIIEKEDPCLIYKAIKNQTEITGAVSAHTKDGIAVTNFLYWLESNFQNSPTIQVSDENSKIKRKDVYPSFISCDNIKGDDSISLNKKCSKITELEAKVKILEYRKKQPLFKQLSFPTISAFNENGAIIHYCVNDKTNKIIQKNGLYLTDSGGQYLDGTTDVTRTIVVGIPTNEQRAHYTIVLKAHVALASAVFPPGTTGGELDILARVHLWKFGMDYMHSTGHGVGSYLSVHEGPQAISKENRVELIPGMILSNEPGYYVREKYGIRIENLMYVNRRKDGFLCFKQLTSVPYDRRLIDSQMLTIDEINWINGYHRFTYKNLKDEIKDKEWLKSVCRPLNSKVL